MTDRSRKSAFFIVICLVAVFMIASVAMAIQPPKSSTPKIQAVPGTTVKTIIGQIQVAQYKVTGVNHLGYLHFDVSFDGDNSDMDIYLIDNATGNTVGGVNGDEEGYSGGIPGYESVDYKKTTLTVAGQGYDPVTGELVGDSYTVVVVAFGGSSSVKVWGYTPRIIEAVPPAAPDENYKGVYNYYNQSWPRNPDNMIQKKTINLTGAAYGSPFNFKPTSIGDGNVTLTWPVDYATGDSTLAPGDPNPGAMESYCYTDSVPGSWAWDQTVFEDYPDDYVSPLSDDFTTDSTNPPFAPNQTFYYIPSLYLYSPTASNKDLSEGIKTITYKAVESYPMNLRIFSSSSKVKKGNYVTISGTYALNGAWQAGKSVVIKKNTGGAWVEAKTVTTDANGQYSYKFKPNATAQYTAFAAGPGSPGLDVEQSLNTKVTVTK